MHGDTVYIKVMTGRYVGELDGTTKLEWVKARGKQKDKEHALTIEKMTNRDEPVKNGDVVMFVMPTGVHMDVLGSAVRARYYDPRGEWQKITIVKQDGGDIYSGDQIFLRGHQGEYLDANPLERAPDGEVKARWRDEGEWQVMWIENRGVLGPSGCLTLAMSSVAALNRSQREKLQNFQQVTGAPQRLAMEFLRRLNWSLDQALDVFFQEGHSCGVQQEHLDAKKLEALFMKYASSEDQTIRPEGIEELCKDLQISALDPVTLVLAWHCRAKQMGIFTREEFTTGMQRLGCDELPKLRAKVADMRQALQDRAACKEVYAFTFQFALDQGQRCLPVDMCIEFWKLLLPAHFALLETWISWVEQNVKNHVSKDTWMMLFDLATQVKPDLSDYDLQNGAWPVVLDEFVDFVRASRGQ